MTSTTTSTNGNRTGEEPMEFIAMYEKDGSLMSSWQNKSDQSGLT